MKDNEGYNADPMRYQRDSWYRAVSDLDATNARISKEARGLGRNVIDGPRSTRTLSESIVSIFSFVALISLILFVSLAVYANSEGLPVGAYILGTILSAAVFVLISKFDGVLTKIVRVGIWIAVAAAAIYFIRG